MWLAAARRLLLPCRASALRARPFCSAPVTAANPLLGVMPTTPALPAASSGEAGRAIVNVKGLPVSPKKLRIVANLARGLYWREAMVQLEFCPKKIAIHVKNAIAKAAAHAEEECGLDPTLLVVEIASVSKGQYVKEADFKAKGRAGILKKKRSGLYVVLRQVTAQQVAQTRFFGRWRKANDVLSMPWDERVKLLPRYKPFPGYEPGEARLKPRLVASGVEAGSRRRQREKQAGAAAERADAVAQPQIEP